MADVVTNIVDDMSDVSIATKLSSYVQNKQAEQCKVLLETQLNNDKRNWDYIFNTFSSNEKSYQKNNPILIDAIKSNYY